MNDPSGLDEDSERSNTQFIFKVFFRVVTHNAYSGTSFGYYSTIHPHSYNFQQVEELLFSNHPQIEVYVDRRT